MIIKSPLITIILAIVALPFSQSFSESISIADPYDFDKQDCELLALDHWQPTTEGRKTSKKWLDVCIERGLITSEIVELAESISGFSTRDISAAYRFSNGDIEETIKILQHPDYPLNMHASDTSRKYETGSIFEIGLSLLSALASSSIIIIYLVKKKKI